MHRGEVTHYNLGELSVKSKACASIASKSYSTFITLLYMDPAKAPV